jgi:hypothetical protein
VDGIVGTNGACQPDSFCLVLHHLIRDWSWEGMPVDTAALFVAQMADADPPLAEMIAALQQKIASLEKTIQDENEEMKSEGVKALERLAALKQDKELLAKMREEKVILLQQQSRTQEGAPRPVCALPNTRCLVCIVELMHHWFSLTLIVQLVMLAPYGHSNMSHRATTSSIQFQYFHGLKCPVVIALVDTLNIRRTSLVLCHTCTVLSFGATDSSCVVSNPTFCNIVTRELSSILGDFTSFLYRFISCSRASFVVCCVPFVHWVGWLL